MRNLLRDTTIKTRVFTLVTLTILLMCLVIGFGLRQINMIGKELMARVEEDIVLTEALNEITLHSLEQSIHLERAIQFGRRMAQEKEAKANFEAERENFLEQGQTVTQVIQSSRAFVHGMYQKYKTTSRRKTSVLQLDYELRNIEKEHSDYQFLAERAFNLLSQGKLTEAESTIQKIAKKKGGGEKEHLRLEKPLETLALVTKDLAEDSIVRGEESKQTAVIGMSAISAFVLLFSLVFAVHLSRGISRPPSEAVNIAERIAAGDRIVEIDATAKDETGQLLQAMKTMSVAVKEAEKSLTQQTTGLAQSNVALEKEITERKKIDEALWESQERYRALVDNTVLGITVMDANHKIIMTNATFAKLFKKPVGSFVGKYCFREYEKREAICPHCPGVRAMASGKTAEVETQAVLDDGSRIHVRNRAIPFFGSDGVVKGFIEMVENIDERKKAEQKQTELLKKVESANKELKDFAYVVSHDLKAPLRGIKTLANWISADYADKLDKDAKEQMELLSSRVDRMHNLIDGILQYSRVGRVTEKKILMNLSELVPNIVDTLAPPESITITIENELPVIECEQTRTIQVFQNLLSNAIKYMDKPQGQIRIGCVEEDGFWTFSVADNGPGIEEKYFEKIFQMFQTLSPRDKFESTGVGLTVVKKIVESHGGKIWVESNVGEGSTFFVTLPKSEMGVKDAKLQANIVS